MVSNFLTDFINSSYFSWFLISIIFWLIVLILIYLLRNKKDAIHVFFPFIALMKTKKLNRFITKTGKKFPKFWKVFWTIGIFISFVFIILAFYFFFINFLLLIFKPKVENIIAPLIPGVTVDLPFFFYLLLPLLFIITTHELAHGIAASAEDVEVKSTGIIGAGIFFILLYGAFVEVDERELYSPKHHRNTRLRIIAAGTYVNGITALIAIIFIFLFPLLISPFYGNQVTQIDTVLKPEQGGFNYEILESGDVIEALKKKSDSDFIALDGYNNVTLTNLLNNQTDKIKCSVGDNLTLKIYDPESDSHTEKNIQLGPYYNLGILYEYVSNSEIKITRIYSKAEGGNNYDKGLEVDLIVTKINGTSINQENGKTLQLFLTIYNLRNLKLTTDSGTFILDVEVIGVRIGILSRAYWMPLNPIGKFFTGNFPDLILRELILLFVIALSISLLNMLPMGITDGDRIVKELINWGIGEDYSIKKKKTDLIYFNKEEKYYGLSEFRVEKINSIKIKMIPEKQIRTNVQDEIILGKDNYELIDKIGDGFKSTVLLNIPEKTKLTKNSQLIINYEYCHDTKRQKKKNILNIIRLFAVVIFLGSMIISFIKFGSLIFF